MKPSATADSGHKLLSRFEKILGETKTPGDSGPFFPPVLTLALEIDSMLRQERIDLPALSEVIRLLTCRGVLERSRCTGRRLGISTWQDNEKALRTALFAMTLDSTGERVPFETFRAKAEKILYGFVFTAHPTFSMSQAQSRKLIACAVNPNTTHEAALFKTFKERFVPPTLDEETEHALEAIRNLNRGIDTLRGIALEVAQACYPEQWTALRPAMAGVATWVGFDLDGRNDIGWTALLARRLLIQKVRLGTYSAQVKALIASAVPASAAHLKAALRHIDQTLDHLEDHYRFFSVYDPDHDPGHQQLQNASRTLIADSSRRLTSPALLQDLLEKTLATKGGTANFYKDLAIILSALSHDGLSEAEVHFRLNAAQIHNAIRKHVDLETHPADPRFRQTYLERLLKRLRKVRPSNVHFGNILEEQASARRMFMVIQQIVKHIDSHAPIRFLIAETESSLTVMGALFLASRFGVENHVDICPLFETERALERGSRIVEHLLDIPEFVSYIRKRGRLCIQTGYSDAGRYIGQSAAAGSIERVKERILRVMDARELHDVDLLFFDTHGESVGRGGHPDSFAARLDYVSPPVLRQEIAAKGFSLIQETSWQGGDGFLWFMSEQAAFAVLTRVMTHWLTPTSKAPDPAYGEDRVAATEFLMIIKSFQNDLMLSPDYGALLSAFGPNLIRPTGSRAIKRQHEGRSEKRTFDAREFRAIPHNAILAQMGMMVNAVSGLGLAANADPAFFERMMTQSPRFANVMAVSLHAATHSDSNILKSYIDTLDPALWLARSAALAQRKDADFSESCSAVALHLEAYSAFESLLRIFRNLKRDDTNLHRICDTRAGRLAPEKKTSISVLHAIRIALIHRIFSMAMEIPNYSPMHDIPRSDLIDLVFRLEIPTVMRELDEIFPIAPTKSDTSRYGEESNYVSEERESYAVEHARIFQPIQEMHALVQDVSAALIHHTGFVG